MNEEEWAGWLRTRWLVIPDWVGTPVLQWRIGKESDGSALEFTPLGPPFEDEETVRHIVRCHNHWLASLQPIGEELNADAAPPEGRAPES